MIAKELPCLNFLKECFDLDSYSPSYLSWKVRPLSHFVSKKAQESFNKKFSLTPCNYVKRGRKHDDGYYSVTLKNISFKIHRIVYAIYYSRCNFSDFLIDHIDGNSLNNNPSNLRLCNKSQNDRNRKKIKETNTGIRNIRKEKNKYIIDIIIDGTRHKKTRNTLEEAIIAKKDILDTHGDEFNLEYEA